MRSKHTSLAAPNDQVLVVIRGSRKTHRVIAARPTKTDSGRNASPR